MESGFLDLCVNVPVNGTQRLVETLTRLYEFGFRTVALNYTLDESIFTAEKKKKKKKEEESTNSVPEPREVESLSKRFEGKLKLISRLTFLCSDPSKTHSLGHCASLKKYNLYAIAPRSQNALQFACSQLNADIITFLPSSSGLKMNRKLYEQAVERGLHFEVRYADVLNPETRKQAIQFSHLFHTYGKSKNVILTSGVNDVREIRNPYDLVILSFLLGLTEAKSKASILQQCNVLLLKAERRRRGKAIFAIEEAKKNEKSLQKRIKL